MSDWDDDEVLIEKLFTLSRALARVVGATKRFVDENHDFMRNGVPVECDCDMCETLKKLEEV